MRLALLIRYNEEYRTDCSESIDISKNIELDRTAGVSPATCGPGRPRSQRLGGVAGVGREAGALDAVHRANLVLVRGVAADPDRTDNLAGLVADQHAARHRHDAPARGRHQRLQEHRIGAGTAGELAAAETHAERAPGLAHRDL